VPALASLRTCHGMRCKGDGVQLPVGAVACGCRNSAVPYVMHVLPSLYAPSHLLMPFWLVWACGSVFVSSGGGPLRWPEP